MQAKLQIDDLLDARGEIRRLSKIVADARDVWVGAKSELTAAKTKLEGVLDELEQRQGRLPFPEPEAKEANPGRKAR